MQRNLALATDYVISTGSPEPYLKRISDAGFTHILWGHHWNDDFIYSDSEIRQIAQWCKKYGLKTLNIHASSGKEKNWISQKEYERRAGIELVKNRIYMAAQLSCKVIILHLQYEPENKTENKLYWKTVHKTFDELSPFAKKHKVKIGFGTDLVHLVQWNGTTYVEEAILPTAGMLAPLAIGDCDNDGLNEVNAGNVAGSPYMEWVFKYEEYDPPTCNITYPLNGSTIKSCGKEYNNNNLLTNSSGNGEG